MYEPYGEKKKFRIDLQEIRKKVKEKVQNFRENFKPENLKSLKLNRWGTVVVALILIAFLGLGFTGYTAYTSKITEAQSKILVLERQVNACEQNVKTFQSDLDVCSSNLERRGEELSRTEKKLKSIETRLDTCIQEKEQMAADISEKEMSLTDLQEKYDTLKTDKEKLQEKYNALGDNLENLECNYAESKECTYFTVEDSGVVCCIQVKGEYYCGSEGILTADSDVKSC